MTGFRILLAAILALMLGYTGPVIVQHGMGLVPLFFAAIGEIGWQGQFNVDFSCFLILSGLWVAWRHNYTAVGLVLAPVASFGGAMFLSAYLLIVSFQVRGDMAALLLGTRRATALRG